MTRIKCQGHTPINDNGYRCHITAIELVYQSYMVHITPLVNNSLRSGHTQKHTHTYTHTHTHAHTHKHIPTIHTKSIIRNLVLNNEEWNELIMITTTTYMCSYYTELHNTPS